MFLAQVVITLNYVLFGRNGSVLTVAERNRIYAVTSKNRIIVSSLGAITTSQFILGLCLITYIAMDGGEFVTKCGPESLYVSMFQRNRSRGSHFRFIWCALSHDIGPWRSDLPPCLIYGAKFLVSYQQGVHNLNAASRKDAMHLGNPRRKRSS